MAPKICELARLIIRRMDHLNLVAARGAASTSSLAQAAKNPGLRAHLEQIAVEQSELGSRQRTETRKNSDQQGCVRIRKTLSQIAATLNWGPSGSASTASELIKCLDDMLQLLDQECFVLQNFVPLLAAVKNSEKGLQQPGSEKLPASPADARYKCCGRAFDSLKSLVVEPHAVQSKTGKLSPAEVSAALLRVEKDNTRHSEELEPQTCELLCCKNREIMNPDLWGGLPNDVLGFVFAHLPPKHCLTFGFLSKTWWDQIWFLRACDEAHPKCFALIRKLGDCSTPLYLVRVFESKSMTWHAGFQVSGGIPEVAYQHLFSPYRRREMVAEDGGLVLFQVLCQSRKPFRQTGPAFFSYFFTVLNPVTRRSRDLPPILDVVHPALKRIIVDKDGQGYKVIILVELRDLRVFDSQNGQWSRPNTFENLSAKGVRELYIGNEWVQSYLRGKQVKCHQFLNNRLFVLIKDTVGHGHYIREFTGPTWFPVDVYRCAFERIPRGHKLTLLASNGFLVVFSAINKLKPHQSDKGWVYDLSTRNWHTIPELLGEPGSIDSGAVWRSLDNICEILWNAHP